MTPARHAWLAAHPFLEPIARLQRAVERAAADAPVPAVGSPRWDAWAAERAAGVPLLASRAAGQGWADSGAEALRAVAEALAGDGGALEDRSRALRDELRRRPPLAREAIAWIGAAAPAPASDDPGLLRFLGWAALRRVLGLALAGPARGDGEDDWGRPRCPICGALPVSAQLLPAEPARPRLLACGCCGTRWRYRRLACPFCGTDEPDRLRVLEVEGEPRLRLDACDVCEGYLKTYTGAGDEDLFLSDWPTLHLDVVALARGLRRAGDSLYALPSETPDQERRSKP